MSTKFTQAERNNFFIMVDSLKKSRRADLSDINSDENIIEKLYADPLNDDLVLKSCLNPNTTVLIGRKGTGKSTIIARLQHEIRKDKDKLSVYLDVNSIFEQSQSFTFNYEQYNNVLHGQELEKYLLIKQFLKNIIHQIKEEVKLNTIKFYLAKISKIFGPDKNLFLEELENIFKEIDEREYEDILIIKEKLINSNINSKEATKDSFKTEMAFGLDQTIPKFSINPSNDTSTESEQTNSLETKISEILLQYFNPKNILTKIKQLLQKIGIKYVFVCLDDFSEIEEQAMKVFVDTIIAPLNNWSDEYFKFKIAAYPGRIYLGNIDPMKIDQIKLDYYDLYLSNKVTDIEEEAINSVERLLIKRFQYFCHKSPEFYFDTSKTEISTYYQYLFNMTANVPRVVGWILWYANQYSISKDKPITLRDLELATEKYFSDTIEVYFSQNKYMRASFNEKLEKYHLNELLIKIIKQAKFNKTEISTSDAKVFEKDKTKPLSSHFYIGKELESLLNTLELNFFITKINEQKDKEGNQIIIYCLNYGLCKKEDINFGKGSNSKYVTQRRFDYSEIVKSYINDAKIIVCNSCKKTYQMEMLNSIKLFDMLCPNCRNGTCEIKHIKVQLPNVDEKIILPEFDLKILNALKIYEPQFASLLAQELDCEYQKVSKRASVLSNNNLIERKRENIDSRYGERTYYYLKKLARDTYFED
jgi:DNA replication protein DnaC